MDNKLDCDLKKRKNKLLKKLIKIRDPLFYCRYKTYRDNLNHLIRKSKKQHYNQYFCDPKNDVKKTRKQINKIILKSKNKDKIDCIKTPQEIETNLHTMDNKFNSHFTTIAQNLVYKIKTMTNFCRYIDPQVQNSIFFSPTTRNRKIYSFSQ